MGDEIGENASGVVDEIAEPLRNQNTVNIAWSGLFDLLKIVIG